MLKERASCSLDCILAYKYLLGCLFFFSLLLSLKSINRLPAVALNLYTNCAYYKNQDTRQHLKFAFLVHTCGGVNTVSLR